MPPVRHPQSRGASVPDTTSSGNDAQGWLWKKSGVFSLWKRKYFVLCGPLLSFYDTFPDALSTTSAAIVTTVPSSTDTSPRGVLRVVHVESTPKGFKVFASSGKVIHVRAETSTSDYKWVRACQRAATLVQRQKETSTPMDDSFMGTVATISEDDSLSVGDGVDHSGWLRGEKGIKYFVLQGNLLTMYENKQPWCVPSYRGYVCSVAKKGYQDFQVTLSGDKVFNLQASTTVDRDTWAQRLYQGTFR